MENNFTNILTKLFSIKQLKNLIYKYNKVNNIYNDTTI